MPTKFVVCKCKNRPDKTHKYIAQQYLVGVGKVSRYSFWWNSEYVPGPAMFSRDMARSSGWGRPVGWYGGGGDSALVEVEVVVAWNCAAADMSADVVASLAIHLEKIIASKQLIF